MIARKYETPESFKTALEQRLKNATSDGVAFGRKRQLLVFDRFLARTVVVAGDAVTLKGGLVLELRLERARTTKDVDLRLTGSTEGVLEKLQEAGRLDLGDHMTFEIAVDDEHPEIEAEGMKYGGLRFRAKCELAGKLYGSEFGVDVAFAGPMLGDPETIVTEDVLEFAGISPPTMRLYPIETHIAEKLHAYTLVRKHPNSRVKDLPDLALLASIQPLEADRIRAGLKLTFDFRATHPVPSALAAPPLAWSKPYEKMVADFDLAWRNLDEVTAAARAFLDPVLASGPVGRWDPAVWRWI